MHVVENERVLCNFIRLTIYLFNLVGGYTARILVPEVLLRQAPFPGLECAVQIIFYA